MCVCYDAKYAVGAGIIRAHRTARQNGARKTKTSHYEFLPGFFASRVTAGGVTHTHVRGEDRRAVRIFLEAFVQKNLC